MGETFVAEIGGIDLARDQEAAWPEIHRAYLDHKVLVFPNQDLMLEQYAGFGARFGELAPHTLRKFAHPDNPAIMILSNEIEFGAPKGVRDAGSFWHSDWSYRKLPANATMLYALDVPEVGGDTLFADMAAAYEALSDEMKQRLVGLTYRGQYRWTKDRDDPESMWRLLSEEERAENPEVEHPVVRTHPETGAKSLFVFPGISAGIKAVVGLEEDESGALLAELFRHVTEGRFQYRFRWPGAGMLVVWDNRCTMHRATTADLPADKPRTLQRLSTVGTAPH